MKGDDYEPAMGIDNPFIITCDSNYFAIPFYKNEEVVRQHNGWFILRPYIDDGELLINFYDVKNEKLHHTEKVELKINRLPNPYLMFLPCDSFCNSLEAIREIESIWPQLYYYDVDIRCRLRVCTISIIREEKVFKQIEYSEFEMDEKFKTIVGELKIGDKLRFSNIKNVRMPDGTTRELEDYEIVISQE